MALYAYALFDTKRRPIAVGYTDSTTTEKVIFNIYGKGCGTTRYEAEQNIKSFAKIMSDEIANDVEIHTTDFKAILNAFRIAQIQGLNYSVYDHCWDCVLNIDSGKSAQKIVSAMLDRLRGAKPTPWKRVFANAAVAYQSIEDRGVTVGYVPAKPIWWQNTYSGRSKNTVVNIQGIDGSDILTHPQFTDNAIFVYFDWLAADLRVAAELSGDEKLLDTFANSDPYTELSRMLTNETGTYSRDDCKLSLLKAINSFDHEHVTVREIFSKVGEWLYESKQKLDTDGYLQSILGRRFYLSKARNNNPLAVLNGMMQGSVAHGMQSVTKRIWDKFGDKLLVEIHDSVAMVTTPESLRSTIRDVAKIMTRPFDGLLDNNPYFPVKVSIGDKFREWKPLKIYRENGVEHVRATIGESREVEESKEGSNNQASVC